MKETGNNLIKQILYLIIFELTEIVFNFHQILELKNSIKVSLKKLSL